MAASTIWEFPLPRLKDNTLADGKFNVDALHKVAERMLAADTNVLYVLLAHHRKLWIAQGYVEFREPCCAADVRAVVCAAVGVDAAARMSDGSDISSVRSGQREEFLTIMRNASVMDYAEAGTPQSGCWDDAALCTACRMDMSVVSAAHDVVKELATLVSQQPADWTVHAGYSFYRQTFSDCPYYFGENLRGQDVANVTNASAVGAAVTTAESPLKTVSALWNVGMPCCVRHEFYVSRVFDAITALTLTADGVSDDQWRSMEVSLVIGNNVMPLHPLVGISQPEARAARVPRGRALTSRVLLWDMEHAPLRPLALQYNELLLHVTLPYTAGTTPPTFRVSVSGVNVFGSMYETQRYSKTDVWGTMRMCHGIAFSDPRSTYVARRNAQPALQASSSSNRIKFVGVKGADLLNVTVVTPTAAVRDFAVTTLGGVACDDGAAVKIACRGDALWCEIPSSCSVYELGERLAGMRITELVVVDAAPAVAVVDAAPTVAVVDAAPTVPTVATAAAASGGGTS